MALKYKDLLYRVRYKLKDNNKVMYSDYDVKQATNEAIRYFNNSYALKNSDFLEKLYVFDEKELNERIAEENLELPEEEQKPLYNFCTTGVELPDDYVCIQGIADTNGVDMHVVEGIRKPMSGQYKVLGSRLYLGEPYATMLYKAGLAEIKNSEDEIEIPSTFKDAFVNIVCMVLQNEANTDVLADAMEDAVARLVPARRYVNARVRMPFCC